MGRRAANQGELRGHFGTPASGGAGRAPERKDCGKVRQKLEREGQLSFDN